MMQTLKLVPNSTKNNFEQFKVPNVQIAKTTNQENDNFTPKETKANATDVVENKSIKKEKTSFFGKIINFFKTILKAKETIKGTAKGVKNGLIAMAAVGFVGKNLQEGKGEILPTIVATGKNIGKIVSTTVTKVIPAVFKSNPKELLSSVKKLPKGFYKYCSSGIEQGAKGSKTVGIVATLAGVGILAYNTIKGMAKGNMKKANVDHYTDNGHIPVK